MKFKIKSKTERPLFQRQEVVAVVEFEGKETPSNNQMIEELAKATGAKKDLVVLKGLDTHFGSRSGELKALVYKTPEAKKAYTPMTKAIKERLKKEEEERKKAEEEAKAAAEEAKKKAEEEKAAAEAAKAEEKPAEEKPAEEKAE